MVTNSSVNDNIDYKELRSQIAIPFAVLQTLLMYKVEEKDRESWQASNLKYFMAT